MVDDQQSTSIDKNISSQSGVIFNLISFIGLILTLVGVLGEIFLFLMSIFSGEALGYQGVIVMLLLMVIIAGLILVIVGYWLERNRRKAGRAPSFSSQTLLQHPVLVIFFSIGLASAVAIVMGTGSYQMYQVTESTEFCGQLCHSVMNPEWVTYHNSSHARVKCVECHIGEGADWFVRSKLSGIRQIYAVLADDFPRPIPTPIHNLRPARETCERCHWPSKFIGYKEKVLSYYLSDEANTRFNLRMLIKIGGEEGHAFLRGSGIHYHMLSSGVEYIAKTPDRQQISYVKVTRPDKSVSEFVNTEDPITENEKTTSVKYVMDCLDCHNRPSHKFRTPMDSVNESMKQRLISSDIPQIKLQAVKALDTEYETTESAVTGIGNALRSFYDQNYPEFIKKNPEKWLASVKEIQTIYQRSIFPEMKSRWKVYPDNIGHRDWPGCFRCHNENMRTNDGKVLYRGCNECHLVLAQGSDIEKISVDLRKGVPFFHPGNDEYFEEYTDCSDCHDGGKSVYE